MGFWPAAKKNHSMAYYAEADLPFQYALARLHRLRRLPLLVHRRHQRQPAVPVDRHQRRRRTRPWPRHGQHLQQAHRRRPAGAYTWTTYPERLERAGIRWRIYQDMADNYALNPTAGFKAYRDAYQGLPGSLAALREKALSTHGLDRLRQDALDGTLPQVSWICPTKAGSEHPSPSSPAQGADYVARVLDALTANPQVWSRTVLLLMFDENDGFFDHMPPPAPPSRDARGALAGASTVTRAANTTRLSRAWNPTIRPRIGTASMAWDRACPCTRCRPGRAAAGQLAGLRPHLGAALHRATLRRGRTQHLALAPRRLRRPDLAVRLQRERARRSRNNPAGNRRAAARAAALPGTATPTAPDQPPPARQQPGLRPSRALPYALHAHATARDHADAAPGQSRRGRRRAACLRPAASGARTTALYRRGRQAPGRHLGHGDGRRPL